MSQTVTGIDAMGVTNRHWGDCGFTSSFYAMYAQNPGQRGLLIGAGIAFRVLAEIKTYLMLLKAEGNLGLIGEIEAFTRSFGIVNTCDFTGFSLDDEPTDQGRGYIKRINLAVTKTEHEIMADAHYSIGMPPQAVADYVTRVWQQRCSVMNGDLGGADGIVGVRKTNGTMQMYGGLCHYLYRKGGTYYSWGNQYPNLATANQVYEVCRFIRFD